MDDKYFIIYILNILHSNKSCEEREMAAADYSNLPGEEVGTGRGQMIFTGNSRSGIFVVEPQLRNGFYILYVFINKPPISTHELRRTKKVQQKIQ